MDPPALFALTLPIAGSECILGRELVPVVAHRFLVVTVTMFSHTVTHVVRVGSDEQVLGVEARWIVTPMKHL
jgi:hypothetical protein